MRFIQFIIILYLGDNMDTKEIFEETGKLGNEIKRLKEKIENINIKYYGKN